MKGIKNIRLKNYDYSSNGYYFVTICADNRRPLLEADSIKGAVKSEMEKLGDIEGVEMDYSVIMPDHLHFIVFLEDCQLKLSEIIRRFKARVSRTTGRKLWQPNFYEHVIRNEKALGKIREYIVNNPEVAEIDFDQFYIEAKT